MSILLSKLIPTQELFRDFAQIAHMIEFVKKGGIFDLDSLQTYDQTKPTPFTPRLISVSQFEDGELYLRDGHHRVVAIYLGGRRHLHPKELFIERWQYSDYQDIIFHDSNSQWVGWTTPFDPKKEVRLPDFVKFKQTVRALHERAGFDTASVYIRNRHYDYKYPRLISSIEELANNYKEVQSGEMDQDKYCLAFREYARTGVLNDA